MKNVITLLGALCKLHLIMAHTVSLFATGNKAQVPQNMLHHMRNDRTYTYTTTYLNGQKKKKTIPSLQLLVVKTEDAISLEHWSQP